MNRCAYIGFICFLGALVLGCDGNKPTMLLGGIQSSISPDEARRRLSVGAGKWTIIEDSHLPPGDKRPRFDILNIEVGEFTHCGIKGTLGLQFYNHRLASTVFYPEDLVGYLRALDAEGIHLEQSDAKAKVREVRLAPHTRVLLYRDYKGRDYVLWEDMRLIGEINRWIERYS